MTDIDKLKKLAVPVSEAKNIQDDGNICLCLTEDKQEFIDVLNYDSFNKEFIMPYDDVKVTHILSLDLLTTKAKAVELANTVGNNVLVDRVTERKINSSNDVAQMIIDLTENQSKL